MTTDNKLKPDENRHLNIWLGDANIGVGNIRYSLQVAEDSIPENGRMKYFIVGIEGDSHGPTKWGALSYQDIPKLIKYLQEIINDY